MAGGGDVIVLAVRAGGSEDAVVMELLELVDDDAVREDEEAVDELERELVRREPPLEAEGVSLGGSTAATSGAPASKPASMPASCPASNPASSPASVAASTPASTACAEASIVTAATTVGGALPVSAGIGPPC